MAQIITQMKYEIALDAMYNPRNGDHAIIQSRTTGNIVRLFRGVPRLEDDTAELYPFSHRYLSELITPRRVKEWKAGSAIFIDAQTGAGKTKFVFQTLYPIMQERNQRLLVFASRSALKQKVKYDAIRAAGTGQDKLLTPKGIEKEHVFGDIEVFTYQDLQNSCNVEKLKNNFSEKGYYGAIVFDEAHFFVSDADFNRLTEQILKFLVQQSKVANITRIYMTGTPQIVFGNILELEKETASTNVFWPTYGAIRPEIPLKLYHFARDYSYIEPFFFPNTEYLIDLIRRSGGAKWLIFVDRKDLAYEIKSYFNEKNIFILSADTSLEEKAKSPELNGMIEKGTFDFDILIATKCLDVGVTIRTKNINIVCFIKNQIDFLQAIGRKRIQSGEKVKLYIPSYTVEDITREISRSRQTLREMHDACEHYPKGKAASGFDFPQPIYVQNGQYCHNSLAFTKLDSHLLDFQKIYRKIQISPTANEQRIIARHFLDWMELENTFSPDMLLKTKQPSELKSIIEQYRHGVMDHHQFLELCIALKPFDPRKDQRKGRDGLSTQTINKIFDEKNLNLKIERSGTKDDPKFRIISKR